MSEPEHPDLPGLSWNVWGEPDWRAPFLVKTFFCGCDCAVSQITFIHFGSMAKSGDWLLKTVFSTFKSIWIQTLAAVGNLIVLVFSKIIASVNKFDWRHTHHTHTGGSCPVCFGVCVYCNWCTAVDRLHYRKMMRRLSSPFYHFLVFHSPFHGDLCVAKFKSAVAWNAR